MPTSEPFIDIRHPLSPSDNYALKLDADRPDVNPFRVTSIKLALLVGRALVVSLT